MRTVQLQRGLISTLASILIGAFASASPALSQDIEGLKAKYKRPDSIPFPSSNPYTPEKAALGKMLYFDPRLSGADNITCASCHNPSFGWESPVALNVGAQNTRLGRQSPTVLNHAWGDRFFWDGRAATLEEQAKGPIEADVEMNMPLPKLTTKLKAVPDYVAWFNKVFPNEGITADSIAKAIATYERTVVSSHAPFDAWIEGDEKAISESAKRGFVLFNGKASCAGCHSGWNFTDNKFHDIGIASEDIGRGKYDAKARHAFKTPSLRDTAQRAPFMHNGSVPDLDAVIIHYVSGGVDRPTRSPLMQPVPMSQAEMADLKAFLQTLTGDKAQVPLPILPN
jgi:cytochrome c peroxidase